MRAFPVDTIHWEGEKPTPVLCEMFTRRGDHCENTAKIKVGVECCDQVMNVCGLHRSIVQEAIPDCAAKRKEA